jgi:integrase
MKLKMTDQALARVKPTEARLEIWDELVPNLLLTVHPTGRKSWSVRYRADGKRLKMSLGAYPEIGLRDAREKARDVLLAASDGENPAHDRRRERAEKESERRIEGITIGDLLKTYERLHLAQLRTGKQAVIFLREFREEYGRTAVVDFKAADFTRLLDRIMLEGHATKANRVHSHVKTFFNWAVGRAILDRNPCDKIKKPAKERRRDRFLSDEEIRLFWLATGEDLEPFGHLGRFLLLTGQRLNEAAKMTLGEVTGRHWHLSAQRVKNGNQHDVFLPAQAADILHRPTRVASAAGYVFTTTGRSPVQSFDKPIQRLRSRMAKMAGREIAHFTYHDLRRTCETGLAMLGTPQPIIDRITNHLTGRGMARTYNQHDYREERTAALQRWADHVEGLANV